jgi:hypothetical protein
VTDLDRQRIAASIGEAFAILCLRVGGASKAETNVRLGFEAILRQLGTPPLRLLSNGGPLRYRRGAASDAELRHILKALDTCSKIFERYQSALSPSERRIHTLVSATRDFAAEEIAARRSVPEMALA